MKLQVLAQEFSVCKLDARAETDTGEPFAFLATTDEEKSLVCPTARVPEGTLAREDGWRGFRVAGPLDFSLVGILARISGALATAGIGLFAVSTFDTDYVFVKAENLERALEALSGAGFEADRNRRRGFGV